jgi:hypothetical protein
MPDVEPVTKAVFPLSIACTSPRLRPYVAYLLLQCNNNVADDWDQASHLSRWPAGPLYTRGDKEFP